VKSERASSDIATTTCDISSTNHNAEHHYYQQIRMAHSQYEKDYQHAKTAIDSGNNNDGLAACETLLTDPELPRYYRIKTLILLASANKEWRQKEVLTLTIFLQNDTLLMSKC
jgi:hypothetical protein